MRFAGDAMTGGYVDSAGDGGASIHKALAKKSPNYGALGTTSMAEQAKEKMTAFSSAGQVAGAGLQSLGAVSEAANMAKAGVAAAEAKASASQFGGMMNMFGGLGAAGIGQIGKGATTDFGSMGASNFDLNKNFWLK